MAPAVGFAAGAASDRPAGTHEGRRRAHTTTTTADAPTTTPIATTPPTTARATTTTAPTTRPSTTTAVPTTRPVAPPDRQNSAQARCEAARAAADDAQAALESGDHGLTGLVDAQLEAAEAESRAQQACGDS